MDTIEPPSDPALTASAHEPQPRDDAQAYEDTHVHAVYEAIAPHFSATRHKAWPRVAEYLLALSPGSIGLDIGCGNGKYLAVNPQVHILASDRSENLVRLARTAAKRGKQDQEVTTAGQRGTLGSDASLVADNLGLPYRPASFDFAISIAVLHHLSTQTRRREAIAAILDTLRPGASSSALLFVWALEQASSRRGFHDGNDQDTLVPWVMRTKGGDGATYQRYYHLYREGELEEDVRAAGGVVVESGYERDNWWAVCRRA